MLRIGGVYADVDTECRQPMDGVLRANDSMVVGWENEFESPAEAEHRHYVRSRQVLHAPLDPVWTCTLCPTHKAVYLASTCMCESSHDLSLPLLAP